ncbi:MAG: signal peptidase I [Mediterranea massiliensis]|nr:signal peptidase I [Mediterranea massiliensis]
MKKKLLIWIDRLMDIILIGFMLVVGWIAMQVFLLTSFRIPSDSMEPTLQAGDAILVEKWSYGARLFDVFEAAKGKQVEIKRTAGLGKVERGDVVVFNDPCPNEWRKLEMHLMKYYVKRCVALPGDTFYIEKGRYRVKGCSEPIGNVQAQERFEWLVTRSGEIDPAMMRVYPGGKEHPWTPIEYGPIYLPQAGDTIKIDRIMAIRYGDAIEWETGDTLHIEGDCVTLGGRELKGYRFKKSYYFMTGDRVENSRDSRYWGLLPEEFIVGKVWRIWKSVDPFTKKMVWERVGKVVK